MTALDGGGDVIIKCRAFCEMLVVLEQEPMMRRRYMPMSKMAQPNQEVDGARDQGEEARWGRDECLDAREDKMVNVMASEA